jgi:hypothetical protein
VSTTAASDAPTWPWSSMFVVCKPRCGPFERDRVRSAVPSAPIAGDMASLALLVDATCPSDLPSPRFDPARPKRRRFALSPTRAAAPAEWALEAVRALQRCGHSPAGSGTSGRLGHFRLARALPAGRGAPAGDRPTAGVARGSRGSSRRPA